MNDENKIIIECLNTFGRVPEQWELLKMINQLQSNWDSLREWLEEDLKQVYRDAGYKNNIIREVLDKMNELEGKNKE